MTSPHNPYKTPASNLTKEAAPYSGSGSIENGISGNYDFSIRAIISEAFGRVGGFKGTCWLAILFYILALFPLTFVVEFLMQSLGLINAEGEDPTGQQILFSVISQVAITAFTLPLGLGLFMLGLKRATDTTTAAKEVFSYYPKTIPLFLTMLLSYLMIVLGFILFILPGIYLMVAYCLALPLVADKNLSPWRALETSRKAVHHHWFRFVGLYLVMMAIIILAIIPIGIGLIWVLPMCLLVFGIVYRNIFGMGGDST